MTTSTAKANAASKAAATAKAAKDAAAAAKTKLASASAGLNVGGGGLPGTLATSGSGTVGWGNLGFTNGHVNQILAYVAGMSVSSSSSTTAPGSTAPNGQFVGTMPLAP